MSTPAPEPPDAKRQRIIDAARNVVTRKGLEATKMVEIATEAKVSKGTLYRFFASKEDLLLAMVVEGYDDFIPVLQELASSSVAPEAKLERWVALLLDRVPQSLDRMKVHFQAFGFAGRDVALERRLNEALLRFYQAQHELLEGIVEAGQRLGTVRSGVSSSVLVASLFALNDGLFWRMSFDAGWRDPARLADSFDALWRPTMRGADERRTVSSS